MLRLVPLLLVGLVLACHCPPEVEQFTANKCRGRPGGKIALYWDMGQESFDAPFPGGSLHVEVIRSIADERTRKLLVFLRVRNRLDYEVRWPLSGVVLHHDGTAVSDPVARDRDPRPNVDDGREKLFKWEFDLRARPVTGRHLLQIDGLYQWIRGARGAELAGPIEIPIYIGGTGAPVMDATLGDEPRSTRESVPVEPPPVESDDDDDRWDVDRPPR